MSVDGILDTAPRVFRASWSGRVGATRWPAAVLVAVMLTTGGCGDDSGDAAAEALEAAVELSLDEYVVDGPTRFEAGAVTLAIKNDGSENHQLTIVATESYETLPLRENGSVEIEKLEPGSLIESTEPLFAGFPAESVTVDLEPGTYLFFCNLQSFVGDKSHVGLGQRVLVTVE